MSNKKSSLLIIYVLVLILYFPLFSTYFSQDDFFHFKVSLTDGSLLSFVKLFGFYPFAQRGIAFYRPIFREATFNIFYSLFGLNQLPFRILQMSIHFINIYLVYLLSQKLFKNSKISFFSALFFGLCAANVGVLYYLAGGIQASGATMFILLCVLSFLNRKYLLTIIFYILALASHELSIITPIIIFFLSLNIKNLSLNKNYKFQILNLLISAIYLYLNFKVIGFSQSESEYQPVFALSKTINTFSWFASWAIGLPEMTVDFVGSHLKLDPRLFEFWGSYFKIIFPTFFLSVLIVITSFLFSLKKISKNLPADKARFWFLMLWFPLGLLPVLFLPLHKKTYYLAPVLPAFWISISYLIYSYKPKLLYFFAAVFLVLNITSILLAQKTYPSIQRARVAKNLLTEIKNTYPTLPSNTNLYIKNDPNYIVFSNIWGSTSHQAYYALNGSDAIDLLYKDMSIKVYYEDLSLPPNPHLDFTARLN